MERFEILREKVKQKRKERKTSFREKKSYLIPKIESQGFPSACVNLGKLFVLQISSLYFAIWTCESGKAKVL
jgi:hypothetical protein